MYSIIRFFQDDNIQNRVIERGLTLEQAQEHCKDPETSSSTCKGKDAVWRTEQTGQWFDGYEEAS